MEKFHVKNIAIAAGIYGAGCFAIVTVFALLNIPGFPEFATVLTEIYGSYGYSVSGLGIFVGAIYWFIEGFVHVGIFALLYNYLQKKI